MGANYMDKDVQGLLYDFLGIEKGSSVDEIIDFGLSAAPIISKVYNTFKLRRFDKRIKNNEAQLNRINQKLVLLDDPIKEMIQNTIFPYILDDLIEEHQEKKVAFILNGFEYIVDEKISEESYIISYYDVLRELRIEDIKRLLEYTVEYLMSDLYSEEMHNRQTLRFKNPERFNKEESYRTHIDYKLESKGIIESDKEGQFEAILDYFTGKHRHYPSLDSDSMAFNFMKSGIKDSLEYSLTNFGGDLVEIFNLDIILENAGEN